MKKFTYLLALVALFLAVNTTKAQPNLPTSIGKVVLVKLNPSAMPEARGKLNEALVDGSLRGYLTAEKKFIVTVDDNATKIQNVKSQVLSVFPDAEFTVVTTQEANVLIEAQRNAAINAANGHN